MFRGRICEVGQLHSPLFALCAQRAYPALRESSDGYRRPFYPPAQFLLEKFTLLENIIRNEIETPKKTSSLIIPRATGDVVQNRHELC